MPGLFDVSKEIILVTGASQGTLAPGYIDTETNRDFCSTDAGENGENGFRSGGGAESDLDGAIMLLASSASRWMTGSVVDGGFLLT